MYFSTFAFAAVSAFITTIFSLSLHLNSVPQTTRDLWCTSQIAACPLICTQETDGSAATNSNTCDPETLQYSCVCDNGQAPNISEYSQTVPFYECQEFNTQCVTNCGAHNNDCAAACTQNHPCGAQNPTRVNTTSTASGTSTATGTASGSSETGTAVYTGFGSSPSSSGSASASGSGSSSSTATSASDSSSGAARVIVNLGQIYGLGVVAAGIFAGFAILL